MIFPRIEGLNLSQLTTDSSKEDSLILYTLFDCNDSFEESIWVKRLKGDLRNLASPSQSLSLL